MSIQVAGVGVILAFNNHAARIATKSASLREYICGSPFSPDHICPLQCNETVEPCSDCKPTR